MRRTMIAATGYKKAGLFGLFLWLALAAIPAGMAQAESLLDQLKEIESLPPAPATPDGPSSPQKNRLPPLRLQIEKATPALDERTKEPVVSIRLTERSGRLFSELTSNNVGRTVEMRIDGKVVMRPIIREPIKGGSVQVSGGFTLAEAREMAERLNSGSARVEVEVVD